MPKNRYATVLALTLISILIGVSAPAPAAGDPLPVKVREVVVPRAQGAIALDGKADEADWRRAPCVGPFGHTVSGDAPERDITYAKLLHDGRALYLFFTCRAKPAAEVTIHRSPGRSWPHNRADRLEIFLNPFPDTRDQYHLDIDRAGGCYGTLATRRDTPKKGLNWSGPWSGKVRQTTDGWVAEARLPFTTFGVKELKPGDLWRFKVGRHNRERGDGPIMWPHNPASSFGSRLADAALYFDRMNLLPNGDFGSGAVVRGAPRPWRASVTRNDAELKGKPQGKVETVGGGLKPGSRALRYVKTELNSNLPQVWLHGLRPVPGATYEFSAMARGDLQNCCLRVSAYRKGRRVRMGWKFSPDKSFKRYAYRFVVPEGTDRLAVGFGVYRHVLGEVVYDDAMVRRVLGSDDLGGVGAAAFTPPTFDPPKDPIHGLEAYCERAGVKPWDLFFKDRGLVTQRLIFTDRRFGTTVWMLDNSPGRQFNSTATVWQPWNADGSRVRTRGYMPLRKGYERKWAYNPGFSRLTPMPYSRIPVWDLEDPDIYYYFVRSRGKSPGRLFKANIRTRKSEVLASWPGPRGHRTHGMTRDGRAVFVQDYNGGIWVPYDPAGKPLPVISILDTFGYLADGKTMLPSRAFAARTKDGHLFRIMTGMRVDKDTGKATRVIVPIAGHAEYLKTFASGRVQFPKDGVLPKTKDVDELFSIYNLYPSTSHGHDSYSPDGSYLCHDGSPSHYSLRDGKDRHVVKISPNGGCYHVCWFYDPRFYTTTVSGYLARYERPLWGGVICQVFSDGTWQPAVDTKLRTYSFSYYQGSDFATLSRDATKIAFSSSMTGSMKMYVAVLQRPQPPRDVTWRADGGAVTLSWAPPPHHKEIRGYLVYRSERSGDGYRLLTRGPVRSGAWRDTTVKRGTPYFYVVTSLENCGVESGYSVEAALAGVGLPGRSRRPLVVYAELERALVDLRTAAYPGVSRGRDWRGASNGYYVYRTPKGRGEPGQTKGVARLAVPVPAARSYTLWARLRRDDKTKAQWTFAVDGRKVGSAGCPSEDWGWVRVTPKPVAFAKGARGFEVTTADAGAQADVLCLASEPGFTPQGARPEDGEAPPAVAGLEARRVRDRAVRLTWRPSDAADLSHYNVYASRKPFAAAAQERRIASVTEPALVDWGLLPGATYQYAVTAVDRRGNESALGPLVTAETAARAGAEQRLVLRFDRAKLAGSVERGKAKGTRAAEFVLWPDRGKRRGNQVPRIKGSRSTWTVEVKRAGKFYFWLRSLPRGTPGGDNTPEMRERIRVSLDGRLLGRIGRGQTDIACTDKMIRPEWWTWAPPVYDGRRLGFPLPPGRHVLTLEDFSGDVRYDVLLITDEPSFVPKDGRLKLS